MKKKLLLILLFLFAFKVNAKEIEVEFNKCVDGDTAWFTYNEEIMKVRFLAIDTPEYSNKEKEEYGKEASEYTCNKLKEAKKIVLETDDNSDEKDKYSRYLMWVFVDDKLLQEELIEEGLAEVAYLYGDYKYTEKLQDKQKLAKKNKVGMWADTEESNIDYKEIIMFVGILILLCIFSKKSRNEVKREAKKELKSKIKKRFSK